MYAPRSEASDRFLPADTVLDSGRLLRRPIDEWAAGVAARLHGISREDRDLQTIRRCCTALNSAALVFVYCGQSDVAEDICRSQLDWLGTLRGFIPAAELAVLAIHPWVNLGRLCRRSKDFRRALKYFGAINTTNNAPVVRFDRWECTPSDSFRQIAEPLCIYETLRTYLQTGDLEGALSFAAGTGDSPPIGAFMLKTELLLHIHLRRGELKLLPELMKAMPWPRDHFGILASHYYSAVTLSALQQPELSIKAMERMANHWIAFLNRPEWDSRDLRLAIELCRLTKHLGCQDLFATFFSAAASAVIGAREVPLASQLLALDDSAMHREMRVRLEGFIHRSGYKAPATPFSAPARLRAAVSKVLEVRESALCA